MRYVMREKILSWGDDFTIRNADGEDVYHVDGKVFSVGDKLSLRNMRGEELAFIDQKLLSLGRQYEMLILASAIVIDLVSHPDND